MQEILIDSNVNKKKVSLYQQNIILWRVWGRNKASLFVGFFGTIRKIKKSVFCLFFQAWKKKEQIWAVLIQVRHLHSFSLTQQQKSWKDPFHNETEGKITPRWVKKTEILFSIFIDSPGLAGEYILCCSSCLLSWQNTGTDLQFDQQELHLLLYLYISTMIATLSNCLHDLSLHCWMMANFFLCSLLPRMQPDYINSQPEFLPF